MKIGDFFKAQGLKIDKNTGKIDKNFSEEEKKAEREKELKKMGYGPNGEVLDKKKVNYDPINEKDYSYSGQYKKFEKKHEELYPNNAPNKKEDKFDDSSYFYGEQDDLEIEKENQKFLDNFNNQENLENFIKTYEENQEEKNDFENENILLNSIKKTKEKKGQEIKEYEKKKRELPEYSEFEINMFKEALNGKLDKKEIKFADGEKMTEKQITELINEFKNEVPEEFVKNINRRLISENFQWENESFKNEKLLVSYFPNKKNPSIKYILKETNNIEPQTIDKIFVDSSVKRNKEVIKDKNGCLLVFCSMPIRRKNKTNIKKPIKNFIKK